jgi:hypothetical protein
VGPPARRRRRPAPAQRRALALALEGEPERRGRVGPPLFLGVADHPWQDDVDLEHLAGGRRLEVLPRAADDAHRLQVRQRVDRLRARGLEEELRDVVAALVERLDAVGEVAAIRIRLPRQRHLQIRLGACAGHRHGPHCTAARLRDTVSGMKVAASIGALMWTLAGALPASAVSVQEAILLAKPAVALVTAEVRAEVTMSCGNRTVTVRPIPFVETGTGWFVDGRGYVVTNAHVVDPAYRVPPWVTHELKKKAIEQACVDPALRAQGLARGQRPDLEESLRREASARALATAQVTPQPQLSVLLSNGVSLKAG